jgi:two-component system chemotaxis response regulator CheB
VTRTVLVVDDSAFMRRVVSELVGECAGFRVVGAARDGEEALRLVHELRPDVVTLDVAMPGLDGLQVLGYVMSETPRPVIVLSGSGQDGLALRALELGAVDFVPKPSGPISLDVAAVRERLHDALHAAAAADVSRLGMFARGVGDRAPGLVAQAAATRAVVVAASTGGPNALTQLVPSLPRGLGAAVLVAQHMPAGFTASLARRLAARAALPVLEAEHDAPVLADHVYVAPGGRHLRVARDAQGVARLALDDGPTVWGVRPCADLLFASAAATFGASTLGVVLTGMGRDGADGLREVRRSGGRALVQSRETAVVSGMPDAALATAGADAVVPLSELASAVVTEVAALRAPIAEGVPA